MSDLRYAVRSLWTRPGFSSVAILTLALGIGANISIFSIVNAVMLRPLPYPESDRLVRVWPGSNFSHQTLEAFETRSRSLSGVSGFSGRRFTLTGDGGPVELAGALVAPAHFDVVAVRPALGRTFTEADRLPGAADVIILGHGLWQQRFGGDPAIIGKVVAVGGHGYDRRTVVGVMPADYRPLINGWTVWAPITIDRAIDLYRDNLYLTAIGRLASDVSIEQASAEGRAIGAQLAEENPGYYGDDTLARARVVPWLEATTGEARPRLLALFGAVGFIFLLACANVANLLLVRATDREQEIAIRLALGAGRGRLVRQLLIESGVLALAGAFAGLLAALWIIPSVVATLPASLPRVDQIAIDAWVLAFSLGASLCAMLLFGLMPALRATRSDLQTALKADGRSTDGRGSQRVARGLMAAECALAVLLVVGAGLMLKSLSRLQQVEPGFDPARLLTLRITPPPARYAERGQRAAFYRSVLDRVGALPGVESAAGINLLPMTPSVLGVAYGSAEHPQPPDVPPSFTGLREIAPGYVETLGVRLLRGRTLRWTDGVDGRAVGLVNEVIAERLWPGADPIGKVLTFGGPDPWFTVVGVVGNVRPHTLDAGHQAMVYVPLTDNAFSASLYLTVRTEREPAALAPAVRDAVRAIDAQTPVTEMRPMTDVLRTSMASPRFLTTLFTLFAAVAIVLGAVGVYGVVAYSVSRRTAEIGIRMALGAEPAAIFRSILASGLAPILAGVGAGLAGALALSRTVASLLFTVTPTDLTVYAAVVVLVLAVGLAACGLPAWRASRLDPLTALRCE